MAARPEIRPKTQALDAFARTPDCLFGRTVDGREGVVDATVAGEEVAVLRRRRRVGTDRPIDVQTVRDGSFVARSNAVARAYRRVHPDDWDGDGIPNGEDDGPRVAADEPRPKFAASELMSRKSETSSAQKT